MLLTTERLGQLALGWGAQKGEVDGVVMPFGQNSNPSFPFAAGLIPSRVSPLKLGIWRLQSQPFFVCIDGRVNLAIDVHVGGDRFFFVNGVRVSQLPTMCGFPLSMTHDSVVDWLLNANSSRS